MRKLSWTETALMGLRLATWRERLAWALGAFLMLALLAFVVAQGANVGAHVGARGWFCGETLKGAPGCIRDPTLPPQGAGATP